MGRGRANVVVHHKQAHLVTSPGGEIILLVFFFFHVSELGSIDIDIQLQS